ncbi:MAG: superinfection immunity protein [Alkalilacustris sp.]
MSIVDNPPLFIALNATLFALGYFIPTLIALTRQRDQRLKLFLVNLLTGWTLIGWMVAFIWAISLPWDLGRRRKAGAGPQVQRAEE